MLRLVPSSPGVTCTFLAQIFGENIRLCLIHVGRTRNTLYLFLCFVIIHYLTFLVPYYV